ncbi:MULTISPECIES: type III secretion system protein SctP [Paraburkholderia]|uniref:type III secretion system protein SctP n=1 Tax=Paraburkholderia TaxID=1822464 RepID=UPI0003768B3B|nr:MULTISPECIES: type III secretion system protein SctP [Paraburkholderia]MDH6146203.1 hypothetical protein [Paraburkholderia sp. WSM4179]
MNRTDLHRVRVLAPNDAAAAASASSSTPSGRQAALFERYRQLAAAAAADQQAEARAHGDEADQTDEQAAHDADGDDAHTEASAMHTAHAAHDFALYGGLHAGRYGGAAAFAVTALAEQRDTPQRGDQQPDADERGSQQGDGSNSGNGADNGAGNGDNHSDGSHAPRAGAARSMPSAPVTAAAGAASCAAATTTATATAAARARVEALSAVTPTGEAPPHLLDYLVSQTAAFCANPAALARGTWQLSISLDPQQLPECDLHLTLSHFDLVLRFETAHPQSRHLISVHAATLRERLAGPLTQSAPHRPRNIEITVS